MEGLLVLLAIGVAIVVGGLIWRGREGDSASESGPLRSGEPDDRDDWSAGASWRGDDAIASGADDGVDFGGDIGVDGGADGGDD